MASDHYGQLLSGECGQPLLHRLTHLDNVGARSGGNGNAKSRFTVVFHLIPYRIGITALHTGNVAQSQLVVLVSLNNHLTYLFLGAEFVGNRHSHAVVATRVVSGVIYIVMSLQRGQYFGRRHT